VKLVPDVQVVVQVLERETTDAGMQGEMTVTLTLTDAAQVVRTSWVAAVCGGSQRQLA